MFTIEEIDLMIDALREYEVEPSQFVGEFLENVVLVDRDPQKLIEMLNNKSGEIKRLLKTKRELVILLQAKLIKLKDQLAANEAVDYLKGDTE